MKEVSEDIVTADTPVPFSALGLKAYLEQQNMKEEGTGEFYKSGDNKEDWIRVWDYSTGDRKAVCGRED